MRAAAHPTATWSKQRSTVTRSSLVVAALVLAFSLIAFNGVGRASATARGSVRVTITGTNHDPIVGRNWTYSITVTNARGQKLSGTETTHYLFSGSVVGTEKPVNVHFTNGHYRDTIQFPATSVGEPLTVEAVVRTKDGSGHADWTIKVKQ